MVVVVVVEVVTAMAIMRAAGRLEERRRLQ
jgi:hypothetical protein